jgi:hypothetical protein
MGGNPVFDARDDLAQIHANRGASKG